jgi:hypothetical protein
MNPHLTHIAYLLDRSGSMNQMQEPAIAAFNTFIKQQLDVPGDANLTLVQFDDAYEVHIESCPVQNVPQLTAHTYQPRGSTALLDAIGRTINDTAKHLQQLPPEQQPGNVVLAIFTDGYENASRHFSSQHISDLIRLHRDEKKWEFLFLAANQDAIATAAAMEMGGHTAANVDYSAKSIRSTGAAMSRKIRSMRLKSTGQMDAQAVEDDSKSLNDILREEESKD